MRLSFLFAYAILRSISNKLGGVITLLISVLIILILPIYNLNKIKSSNFYLINKIKFWLFINIVSLLTWIGIKPVETPFVASGQVLTFTYFLYYIINPLIFIKWDKTIINYLNI